MIPKSEQAATKQQHQQQQHVPYIYATYTRSYYLKNCSHLVPGSQRDSFRGHFKCHATHYSHHLTQKTVNTFTETCHHLRGNGKERKKERKFKFKFKYTGKMKATACCSSFVKFSHLYSFKPFLMGYVFLSRESKVQSIFKSDSSS